MPKRELKFQKEMIDVARKNEGYGLKMNNRFIGGIPDVLIKIQDFQSSYFIEVKHEDFKCVPDDIKLKLTPLQRTEIKKMQAAGMQAGWAVFITKNGKDPIVVSGSNTEMQELHLARVNKIKWDKSYASLCDVLRGVHNHAHS